MNDSVAQSKSNQIFTQAEIEAWLSGYLSQLLDIDKNEIDVNLCLDRYGLDSSGAIGLVSDLSNYISYELEPTLLEQYPTIAGLSKYCASLEEITI